MGSNPTPGTITKRRTMTKNFFEMMAEHEAAAEKDLFQRLYKKIFRKEIVCRWGIVEWGFWGLPIRFRFDFEYRWFIWKWFQLRHGFDPRDCWNLDSSLTKWIVPRLKYFKEHNMGHPCMERTEKCWLDANPCDCSEKWIETIDNIIEGFEVDVFDMDDMNQYYANMKKRKKAFKLLGKWGQSLWI